MIDDCQPDPTKVPAPVPGTNQDESLRPRRQRRQTLQRTTPMARSQPIRRTPMERGRSRLSARERAAYRLATERARAVERYIECEGCGRSLLDGDEQRHHIRFRSQGGKTEPQNLAVLCHACHALAHGIREA
jgi:5-methylcytosine-specific restriction endonuclease McrA